MEDTTELMAAISEMERENYLCSVADYDEEHELFLITWTDSTEREWGFWGTRRLIEKVFDKAVIN